MKILSWSRYALGVLATVSMFAGCNSGAQSLPGSVVTKSDAVTVRPNSRLSWMDPHAKKNDLYYISDNGTDAVYVYAYEPGKGKTLVGTLTNFTAPKGLCVDKSGNVFITDDVPYPVGPSKIFEYAHAARAQSRH
jgi:hypothetical protein